MAVNEYDSLAANDPELGAGSEYDALELQAKESAKQSISTNMYLGTKKNPDQRAKAIELANLSGLPVDVVERNFESVSQEQKVRSTDYDSIVNNTPGLAKWLENPDNADVAHDDLDNLAKLENKTKDYGASYKALASFNDRATRLASGLAKAPNLAGAIVQETVINPVRGTLGLDKQRFPTSNPVADWLDKQADVYGGVVPELNNSLVNELAAGNYKKAGATLGYQFAGLIPQLLVSFGTAGSSSLVRALGLSSIGVGAAAERAKELDAQGVEPSRALPIAVASGAIEYGSEELGTFRFIKEMGDALVKQAGKEGTREIFKSMANVTGAGGFTESIEEGAATVANAIMDYVTGVDPDAIKNLPANLANSMILGFAGGAGGSAPGVALQSYARHRQEMQANAAKDFYDSFGEDAKASKLRARLPEAQRQYIEEIIKDGPVENIYIQPEALERYFQSKDESVVSTMESLGLRDAYTEAKEAGTPVKIPYATWVSTQIDKDAYAALSNDVTFDPNSPSVNEQKAEAKEIEEKLKEQEAKAKEMSQEDKISESGKAVTEDVAAQLKAIGEDPRQATIYRGFEVLARRTGQDPLELYNNYRLRISKKEQASEQQGQVFNQEERRRVSELPEQTEFPLKNEDTVEVVNLDTPRADPMPATVVNAHTGWSLDITSKGINKANSQIKNDTGPIAIEYIDKLLERAVYFYKEPYKGKGGKPDASIKFTHHFYVPIAANGKQAIARLVVNETNMGKKFYHSIVVEKEVPSKSPPLEKTLPEQSVTPRTGDLPGTSTIAQLKDEINVVRQSVKYFQSQQIDGPVPSGFYSRLIKTVEEKMGGSATVEQINGMLKEIKPEERKWMGLDEFLKGKAKVSKEGLLEYLRGNMVQIEEVTKAEDQGPLVEQLPSYAQAVQDMTNESSGERTQEEIKKYIVDVARGKVGGASVPDSGKSLREEYIEKYGYGVGGTKFGRYVLPGGENYREVLFTMPPKAAQTERLDPINGWKKNVTDSGREIFTRDINGVSATISFQEKGKIVEGPKDAAFPFSVQTQDGKPITAYKTRQAAESYIKDMGNYILKAYGTNFSHGGQYDSFEAAATELVDRVSQISTASKEGNFKSSHFDEANILAHTRLNDRTDAEGKKVLFVEEIQSDWHQAGRKKGYKGDKVDPETLDLQKKLTVDDISVAEDGLKWRVSHKTEAGIEFKTTVGMGIAKTEEAAKEYGLKAFNEQIENANDQKVRVAQESRLALVPDAPFRKTWHEFVLKRLIVEAAQKGYDKIAWTIGEQQADRYDLSKSIDNVQYNKKNKTLFAEDLNGNTVIDQDNVSESDLSDYIGKEAAEKILKEENRISKSTELYELSGAGLKVGGEGMKGFYDKILPEFASKFGKKYGAKVVDGKIKAPPTGGQYYQDKNADGKFAVFFSDPANPGSLPEEISVHKTKRAAIQEASELNAVIDFKSNLKVHEMEITPELKQAALGEGFSLFQTDGKIRNAEIEIGADRQININLLKTANKSSFIHETGHFYVEVMGDLVAQMETLPERTVQQQQVIDDYYALIKWGGAETRGDISEEVHEKIATGFERYLFEGKAPTETLRSAFARFRVWLVSVYKSFGPNAQLTDEVRDVFDRLLATDEEINQVSQEMNFQPLFGDPKFLGMSIDKTKAYLKAVDAAKEEAIAIMNAKLMAHHEKVRSQEYRSERDLLLPEITERVSAQQIYQTLDKFKTQTLPNGQPFRISKESLMPYGKDVAKGMASGTVSSKGGIPVGVAAEILGYDSEQDLVTALTNVVPKQERINQIADLEMEQKYPDLLKSPELEQEVVDAYHNSKRAQMLNMELEYLVSNEMPVVKEGIRRITRRPPNDAQIKAQARAMIAKKAVLDIKPHIYKRAEAKAAKEAGVLFAKGDLNGAFEAKLRERLNFELYVAAQEANENVEKYLEKFKKILRKDELIAKTRDMDMVNAARSILSRFGIGSQKLQPADEYLRQIKEYDPETYGTISDLVTSATREAAYYDTVSYDAFMGMGDAVLAIWDLSKDTKEIDVDGKRMTLEQAKDEISAEIVDITGGPKLQEYTRTASFRDKVKIRLLGARAALTRVEPWADAVGAKTKAYIYNTISQATTRYRLRKTEVMKQYLGLLQDWAKGQNMEKIRSKELGHDFTNKTDLMMALLHSGNGSNLSKLLRGRGWGAVDQDGVLDTSRWDAFISRMQQEGILTKADYDFAQQIWDLNESLKPEAQRAHKRMYGYYFSEITADKITTPFGEYRGGYIPAKVDTLASEDADIRREREEFEKNNNSFQFPTTGRGFTKSRIDAYAAPLSLDMNLLGSHIDGVLRFAHIEPSVKQVARLVSNKELRATLKELDPTIAKEMLIPWLQRAAQQKVVYPADDGLGWIVDKTAAYLRRSVAMQIMFGNIKNALEQTTGLVVAMSKVKPKHIRNALITYISNGPSKTVDDIMDKSDFMKTIYDTTIYQTYEGINEILVNPSVFEKIQDFSRAHTYFLQAATQNIVNSIVWTGAYEQAIEAGSSEAEAVKAADSAVRLTQGTNLPEDIARHETGTAGKRLFTQFSGYFIMLANLNASELQKISRDIGLKKGAGKAFYLYLTAFMLPAVMARAIGEVLKGTLFDDDDDDGYADDLLAKFFGSQAGTAVAMIPFVGQGLNALANGFNKNMYDDRISLSPVVSTIETMTQTPANVYKAISGDLKTNKKVTKDVLMFVGTATGTPVGALSKPVGYLIDVNEGKANPEGPVDVARGLITGKSESK